MGGGQQNWDISLVSGTMGMATVQHSNEHLPHDVFTVMGYNVLADIHARPELFPHCKPDDLKWAQRRAKLKREIIYHHNDVVCLHDLQSDCDPDDSRTGLQVRYMQPGAQSEASEDNHFAYFADALAEAAYRGALYKRRRPPNGGSPKDLEIGTAIFWDPNRMEFIRKWAWELSED